VRPLMRTGGTCWYFAVCSASYEGPLKSLAARLLTPSAVMRKKITGSRGQRARPDVGLGAGASPGRAAACERDRA
jgi:hypothetical protein